MGAVHREARGAGKGAVPPGIDGSELDRLLDAALVEDLGSGDRTGEVALAPELGARGRLIAKASGVVAGLGVFARTFERVDARVRTRRLVGDGDAVRPGDALVELEGPARALVAAERTALNLVGHLSGVATLTRAYVERAAGGARILDTRKTTPLLRALEKYAVRCGGGENHRFGLFDEVMVKENHVDAAGTDRVALLRRLRERHGPDLRMTAEARDEAEALAAVEGDADVVLLDNLAPEELAALVPVLRRAARGRPRALELEASGGVTLENVARYAATGVDRISVGALTHSAPALDLSLLLEVGA